MKYFKKALWMILAFHLALILFVIVVFRVDDMTLSKGEVYDFNENWLLTGQDGSQIKIERLPYLGNSAAGETVIMENTIPEAFFGKTMAFLSADKSLKVWMDDELVYEFGMEDKRSFGHTPGSVYNFIDIPYDLTEGRIRMEMVSPYDDYAARASVITIGDRDVLILKLLEDNLIHIFCNLMILFCGIAFFMLFLIQLASKQDTNGMQYLCGYCVVTAVYYFIETKVLQIFYGNQTLYSVLVFLCIMMIPFFIALYYANTELGIFKLRWRILLSLICINIPVQLVLQLTNSVDFMNMSFFSHGLITLTVLVVAKSYLDIMKQEKNKGTVIGMIALVFMGIGGTVDIVRMYVVAVGDMGKFSRLGTLCFSMIMLYQHFNQVIKGYVHNIEENARLLRNEVELIEKKNEQLKEANLLAEEARLEALAANTAKGKFLARMSHEIRTPINAVLGMDTMILRETTDSKIKEYAMDIQNAGQNLLSLINDILDFSKIESGKLEIIPTEYDFSSMIHDISNMIRTRALAKNLTLNIHVDEGLPSRLLGDDVRIRQVLVNLLNNAVKYTPKGQVTLTVTGRTEERKVLLEFSVEDTGIGIKEEDFSKLYEEFARIEEKRNRNIEGTGLGMSITMQLLLLMGSRLNIKSVYGEGSCFSFTLEQQIVDSTPVGNLEERIREQSTDYSYTCAFVAPDAHILVVDDNLMNLKVFVSLLKPTGIKVDVADSGMACLELLKNRQYDLIFLDHMMPQMDGIEVLHKMKEWKENPCVSTPVIALTANAITGAREMYLAEGFNAFLPKPIQPQKLEQMILKLLPRELLCFDVEEASLESEREIPERSVKDADSLPVIEDIDFHYGLLHLPDKELLLSTLQDFYKTLIAEADTLEEFYRESKNNPDMLSQYRIKVHSMKSTANLIGATVLGGMAKILENAAKADDRITMDALHDIFLKEWRGYHEKLKPFITSDTVEAVASAKQEVTDVAQLVRVFEDLRDANADLDIDRMDAYMDELECNTYPAQLKAQIEKLSVCITNMDSEQADTLIVEIIKQLKGENQI